MSLRKVLLYALIICFSCSLAGCDFSGNKPNGGTKEEKEQLKFVVYRPDQNGEWLVAETHEKEVAKGTPPVKVALETLLREQPQDDKLVNVFPEKVQLLEVKTTGNTAEINLSKDILDSKVGGSLNELMLVSSLVNTATQFPEITQVQLLVEGKKVETIAGHMDILDPLQRNESIIKKD